MRLFKIGADFQVELDREWILLVPEFQELVRRDRGSEGDYRGDKKLKARKELTFIYFDCDFGSPLREWDEFERREEAMRYAGLKEKDLDAAVMSAHAQYTRMLDDSSRSLRTYKAVVKSLDQLDRYFESVDFTLQDKKGELIYDTKAYLANLKTLGDAYESVEKFKKRVDEELTDSGSIRGKASMGGKEGKRDKTWNETTGKAEENEERAPVTSMAEVGKLLNSLTREEEEETD
jgi:hypothetical protein